jgi:hypothetical protein
MHPRRDQAYAAALTRLLYRPAATLPRAAANGLASDLHGETMMDTGRLEAFSDGVWARKRAFSCAFSWQDLP